MSRKTAFHEAGHVLVALALGKRLEAVSVDPVGARAGQVTLDAAFIGDATDAELEDAITIAHAGQLAEEHA